MAKKEKQILMMLNTAGQLDKNAWNSFLSSIKPEL